MINDARGEWTGDGDDKTTGEAATTTSCGTEVGG